MRIRLLQNKRAGFSLIELLVVMTIITILASMLFPVFSAARAKARQIVCLSNLKQITLALQMYLEDWGGYPMHDLTQSGVPGFRWTNELYPYLHSTEIFHDPSANRTPSLDSTAQVLGYNWQYLGNGALAPFGGRVVYESAIPSPSETIAIADSAGIDGVVPVGDGGFVIDPPLPSPEWAAYGPYYYGWGDYYMAGQPARVDPRHQGGLNIGFCDGHAKWYREAVVMEDNSMWNGRAEPTP
jgi:prepilin-type N-terminal cleavage/methylation domain-containing protein/prepilin-type processing-associated H-X9-DG protein